MAFVESTGTPSYDVYPSGYVRDISSWIDRQQWEQTGGYGAYYQTMSTQAPNGNELNLSPLLILVALLVFALALGK